MLVVLLPPLPSASLPSALKKSGWGVGMASRVEAGTEELPRIEGEVAALQVSDLSADAIAAEAIAAEAKSLALLWPTLDAEGKQPSPPSSAPKSTSPSPTPP
jgi:hypothetical protein